MKMHQVRQEAAARKDEGEKKTYYKVVATNRRARHDYHIEETYEAGIELHGSEVKSLRLGRVEFADAYARVYENQCWIMGLQIKTYGHAHVQLPDPVRQRRLLLKGREIEKLRLKSEKSGYTIVPLEIYFKDSWAKVKLGLARGKQMHDKREAIKQRMASRDIDRALKDRRKR